MDNTYNSGWTVQDFLNSMAGAFADQPSGQSFDPSMLNQQTIFGYTPQDELTRMGITDPMNNLSAPVPDARDSSGDEGEMFDKLVMAAVGALGGAMIGGAGLAGGVETGGAGAGGETLMPPAIAPASSAGYAASPFVGSEGALGTMYTLTDPAAVAAAGMGGAGFAPTSALTPGGGGPSMPSVPPGASSAASTVAQQIAKALTGGAGAALGGGLQGYMQGATPASQGYVRKSRPPLTQPAFLGDQGQQPLGSAEDSAFNEMVAGRGEDTSTRAKQMAAQLRGRPGVLGFKYG